MTVLATIADATQLAGAWRLTLAIEGIGGPADHARTTEAELFHTVGDGTYGPISFTFDPGAVQPGQYLVTVLGMRPPPARGAFTTTLGLLAVKGSTRRANPVEATRAQVDALLNRASTLAVDDVRGQAIVQFRILDEYHAVVLNQAQRAFLVAMIGSLVGLGFFVVAVTIGVATNSASGAVVPAIAGAVVEVVAGLAFALHRSAAARLDDHSDRLGGLQRLLIANSMAEAVEEASARDRARIAVIERLSDPTTSAASRTSGVTDG